MQESPYSVESMGLQMFQQARFLSVYGAFIALQAQEKIREGRGAPDQSDVDRYVEEAATLANMVAISNKEPER